MLPCCGTPWPKSGGTFSVDARVQKDLRNGGKVFGLPWRAIEARCFSHFVLTKTTTVVLATGLDCMGTSEALHNIMQKPI